MSMIDNIKFQIPTFFSDSAIGIVNKFSKVGNLFSSKISSVFSKTNAVFSCWKTGLAPASGLELKQPDAAALSPRKPYSYLAKGAAIGIGLTVGGAIAWYLKSGFFPDKTIVTANVLQDHIEHVRERKNFPDAFNAAITARELALQDYAKRQKCLVETPYLDLKYDSTELLNILVQENLFHDEILKMAKEWASTHRSEFMIESEKTLLMFIEKGKYKEVFEAAQLFPSNVCLDNLLNALIKKDVFLLDILNFVQKRSQADQYHSFDNVLQSLVAKGIGRSEMIAIIANASPWISYTRSIKELGKNPEGLKDIVEFFSKKPSLQNRALEFFQIICDPKEKYSRAAANAIRELTPSIKDLKIVKELEKFI